MNQIPRLFRHPSLAALPVALLLSSHIAGCEPAADGELDVAAQALSAPEATPEGSARADKPRDRGPRAQGDRARDGRGMGPAGKPGRGGPPDPATMFARWDADGDGKVAVKELPERAQERLGAADQDADGSLTPAELQAFHAKRQAERLAAADKDGDGAVSDAEREAIRKQHRAERFAEADKNRDGALTQDEVDERRWTRLATADADGDGRVTQAEHDAAVAAGKLGPRHGRGHGDPSCDGKGMRDGKGPRMNAPAVR